MRWIVLAPLLLPAQILEVQSAKGLHLALKECRNNGEADTIILGPGTYSTKSENIGTFTYEGNEGYELAIKAADGVLPESVILTGGNSNRVLKLTSPNAATTFRIQGITIRDGYTTQEGAGVDANASLVIENSRIYNNVAKYSGGGVFAPTVKIDDSSIFSNETEGLHAEGMLGGGGGVYAQNELMTDGSSIYLNSSGMDGGAVAAPLVKIYNSELYSNTSQGDGGAVFSGRTIIANSMIYNNKAASSGRGAGVMAGEFNIYNSTIWNNSAAGSGDGIFGYGVLANSLLYNVGSDIDLYGSGMSYIYHNYLDYPRLKNIESMNADTVFLRSNIQILDEDKASLIILPDAASDAPYIDKGINPDDALFNDLVQNLSDQEEVELRSVLQTDMDGSARVHNGTIDGGPQEYGASYVGDAPIITSFEASGEMKVGKTIVFTYSASVDSEYTIEQYAINYGDGGSYIVVDANGSTYSYNSEGTYTVSLRVADSADNVVVKTLELTIESLIDQDVRDYCTENPDECQFGSDDYLTPAQCKPDMSGLGSGWHLLGTGVDFDVSEIPVNYEAIWKYPDGNWSYDFTTVEAGKGFWILVP